MLKESITFTDYNGEERTEDFYFNLSKAELMEMELGKAGGMKQYLETIVAKKTSEEIMAAFKDIILNSYGEKSPDGRRFIKSKELSRDFEQTEAYSELFMKLASEEGYANKFIDGILPDMSEEEKQIATIDHPAYN